jgi:hypothetical protein
MFGRTGTFGFVLIIFVEVVSLLRNEDRFLLALILLLFEHLRHHFAFFEIGSRLDMSSLQHFYTFFHHKGVNLVLNNVKNTRELSSCALSS